MVLHHLCIRAPKGGCVRQKRCLTLRIKCANNAAIRTTPNNISYEEAFYLHVGSKPGIGCASRDFLPRVETMTLKKFLEAAVVMTQMMFCPTNHRPKTR